MKIINKLILFIFTLLLLTGCWDAVSIEERGFIIGSAIDIDEKPDPDHPELTLTNQMVLPSVIASTIQSGGGDQKPFINFTVKSKSTFNIDEKIVSRSSKQPFYEHLTVLVISEEVAKTEKLLENLLDSYIRDVDFRHGTYVAVSKEKAKETFEYTTDEELLPVRHIEKIIEQGSKQIGNISPITIGDLEEFHLIGKSYVLPYLEINDFVEQKKGAVFHGNENKMVGIFNEEEMQGLEFMKSTQQLKLIEFTYEDKTVALKIFRLVNNITVDPSNLEDIKVKVEVHFEGTIKESFVQRDLTSSKEIESLQKAAAEHVKKSMEKAVAKGQGEYGADVFDVWKVMQMKHYDTWKDIKDDWEQGDYYFNNVTFEYEVIPQIYSVGTTNQTKEND